MTPSLRRKLFGTDEAIPATTTLRAGSLTLDLRAGRLWHLRLGDVEVWHGVAFLYRDPDWGTPEPVIERTVATVGARTFRIRLRGHFPAPSPIDFRLELEGAGSGTVRVSGEAIPRDDIAANRMGLCVMHPMAAGGCRVDVEHVDGRISRTTFPTLIPPWPPFMLVRALRHEYADRRWARCAFDGDAFEVEDQRNNGDASFKTYSRSNMMPRPYWLRAGVPIRQSVELSLETPRPRARAKPRDAPVVVRIGEPSRALPPLGIEIASSDGDANAAVRTALAALRPAHLHLAIAPEMSAVDWASVAALLQTSGARLRIDAAVSDIGRARAILRSLRAELHRARITPESVAVFPSAPACVDAARAIFPRSRIGGGTPAFFVQLNRAEHLGRVDFLSFTTSAIVHGIDDDAVMLGLQSVPSMLATLAARYPRVPVRVGPGTIAARASPLGKQPLSAGTRRITLADRDPRSRGLFGAAWALGYLAQLLATRVEAITLMSLLGASGVLDRQGSRVTLHPAYHVLAAMQGRARIARVAISSPAKVAAIAPLRGNTVELLLANLTAESVAIDVDHRGGPLALSVIDAQASAPASDAESVWRFVERRSAPSRVTLGAYAVARAIERA
jgi:hypothetical protein